MCGTEVLIFSVCIFYESSHGLYIIYDFSYRILDILSSERQIVYNYYVRIRLISGELRGLLKVLMG